MLGLEAPDAGRIIVEEEDITDLPEEELYRVRKKFGMLFQSGALFDSMTVFENVAFPLREHTEMSEAEIQRAVNERLELVNLPHTGSLMPVDLSGGMRKRVGLARSIVLDPKMILYDEPTTGLDPITAQKINELIIDLQSKLNVTSVVVTHDIQSAFSVGDRIAFLNNGMFRVGGNDGRGARRAASCSQGVFPVERGRRGSADTGLKCCYAGNRLPTETWRPNHRKRRSASGCSSRQRRWC